MGAGAEKKLQVNNNDVHEHVAIERYGESDREGDVYDIQLISICVCIYFKGQLWFSQINRIISMANAVSASTKFFWIKNSEAEKEYTQRKSE